MRLFKKRPADAASSALRGDGDGEHLRLVGGEPVEDEPGRTPPTEGVAKMRDQRVRPGLRQERLELRTAPAARERA